MSFNWVDSFKEIESDAKTVKMSHYYIVGETDFQCFTNYPLYLLEHPKELFLTNQILFGPLQLCVIIIWKRNDRLMEALNELLKKSL